MLCAALYITFMVGVSKRAFFFADADEKQVALLQDRIQAERKFEPIWVPPHITYINLNAAHEVLSSNGSPIDQELAQAYLAGEEIPMSKGYFVKSPYPGGVCVFKYQIGVRYSSNWANRHLPRVEMLFMTSFVILLITSTILYVRFISKRLEKNISPLKQTVSLIGTGNLNYPVPHLSIKEFEELGVLTERMRLDLKNTLQIMWINEERMKEATAQLLHDYRTPLTVARANVEFLREDLSTQIFDDHKEKLLAYTNAAVYNLDRLIEIGDRLQEQIAPQSHSQIDAEPITFFVLNKYFDTMGIILSEYYGDIWQSNIQHSQETLPIDEKGFKQMITNILINAFEHGSSPQTVQLEFEIDREEALYLITNSGSCFSKRALKDGLKKAFTEKEDDQQVIKGLDLYFAKAFIEKHGGTIRLSNSDQNQACVRISLPLNCNDNN